MELINIFILFGILNSLIYFFHEKLIKIFNTYDYPNKKRKIHKNKTSLLGGLILFVNCCFFFFIHKFLFNSSLTNMNLESFIFGATLIFLLGFYDDKFNLNANLKFLFQIIFLVLVVLTDSNLKIQFLYFASFNYTYFLNDISFMFSVICILIFINALNMYDGINLQVGIYSLIIFIALMYFSKEYIFLSALIISLVVFLILNNRSIIFLGDSGSNLLGYIISFIIIYEANTPNYPNLSVENIFILMMLPGIELIRLFVIRLSKGRHPFSADNKHIHHLLISKNGYFKTILFTKFFVISPIILMILLKDYYLQLIVSYIIFYALIIAKYEK